MLILTRKPGQTIRIGDDIEVHILNNDGYQTKIGITAPEEIPVHRDEVYQRILEEQEETADIVEDYFRGEPQRWLEL